MTVVMSVTTTVAVMVTMAISSCGGRCGSGDGVTTKVMARKIVDDVSNGTDGDGNGVLVVK